MLLTIGIAIVAVSFFAIILTVAEEYRWAKQDGRKMFRDKFGNWSK